MPDTDPVEAVAGPLVDGLAKTGQIDAILGFGVTWTGGASVALSSGKDPDAHYALLTVELVLVLPGAFLLLKRLRARQRLRRARA